jgi:DNA (cytosine-5)-methyltransferase 1
VSEIDAFPRSVLEQRHGAVAVDWDHRHSAGSNITPLFGDFTKIEAHHVGPIDILVGGTPCQSFSIAGLRGGLDDDRGNLALEYLRLADRTRPRWLVWENVPGVLSSNGGRDFGAILGGMAELGYGFAYRVLDAQFFGLAQRRRRVFVVGHIGDWRRAAAVLFERHSLSGHPAPSRKARQVAPTIPSRRTSGGGLGTDFDCDGGLINWPAEVAPTLNAAFGSKLGLEDQHIRGGGAGSLPDLGKCLTTGVGRRYDPETETLIPTIGGVFDVAHAIQAGALRENPNSGPDGVGVQEGIAYTLEARAEVQAVAHAIRGEGFDASEDGTGRGTPLVPVVMSRQFRCEKCGHETVVRHQPCPCCLRDGIVPFDTTQITSAGNFSNPRPGDPYHPLAAMGHAPAIAFPAEMSATQCAATENLSPAISVKQTTAVAFDMRGRDGGSQFEGPHDTANIRASSGGSSRSYVAASAVRRLTSVECERLQGFPDDYTLVTHRNKPAADGPRYKALGNSMAVPCMAWIGERIAKVDALP